TAPPPAELSTLSLHDALPILELGMNHAGEIDYLSDIVEPDVALITNIGDSHIEFFGSREKILEAKCEIFHHAKPNCYVVLNGDRSEEHTSELQSRFDLVCRLL